MLSEIKFKKKSILSDVAQKVLSYIVFSNNCYVISMPKLRLKE